MLNLKTEIYLKFIFLVSFTSISTAYFIEYILGHQPCNLCVIERIPYMLSIILIISIFIFKKIQKHIIKLLIILFVISIFISIYHFGIERGIFEESGICSLKNPAEIISKEELLNQLSQKTVSCKDVTFRIFGFSLTTINIFLNLLIIVLLVIILKSYEKIR
jgi:disulfide bond formation protein DsbB